ncbi:unnamed protein product [Prunus brigantina]
MKSQNPTFILMIQLMQIWSCRMGTIQWHKVRIQWFKVDTLIHIIIKGISPIDGSPGNDDTASIANWPSKKDIGHLFEFSAYYVACGRANVSKCCLRPIGIHFMRKRDFTREGTFVLVINNFTSEEGSHILSELRSHPKSLFFVEAYLERISDFPKLLCNNPVNVTDDMIELYLELLCQYERNRVLKFLDTFDSYCVEGTTLFTPVPEIWDNRCCIILVGKGW